LRRRLKLKGFKTNANEGYFLIIKGVNILPLANQTMGGLWEKYKNKDNILEFDFCKENAFGFKRL
jgi:hypothetical protein